VRYLQLGLSVNLESDIMKNQNQIFLVSLLLCFIAFSCNKANEPTFLISKVEYETDTLNLRRLTGIDLYLFRLPIDVQNKIYLKLSLNNISKDTLIVQVDSSKKILDRDAYYFDKSHHEWRWDSEEFIFYLKDLKIYPGKTGSVYIVNPSVGSDTIAISFKYRFNLSEQIKYLKFLQLGDSISLANDQTRPRLK